jgi:hypothetical protein
MRWRRRTIAILFAALLAIRALPLLWPVVDLASIEARSW